VTALRLASSSSGFSSASCFSLTSYLNINTKKLIVNAFVIALTWLLSTVLTEQDDVPLTL
jgi:hypothetical protein